MITELRLALEQVARRFRHVRLWSALALCWLTWACVGLGLTFMLSRPDQELISGRTLLVSFALVALITGIVCVISALRSVRDPRWVARRIEAKHPELNAGLLAAVEQDTTSPSRCLGFLQAAVIREALEHRRSNNWDETVSTWTLRGTQLAHAAALALLIVVSTALVGHARSRANGLMGIWPGAKTADVQVDPGNTEIERGTSLLVVARFKGTVPAKASLVVDSESNSTLRRDMTRSLEDPTFAGRVETVDADLSYHVEFAGQSTETYHVTVFEYPEVLRTDARLVFPQYTSLQPKTVEDIRHVTAVEGTELTLLCRLNKDVVTARLVDEENEALALASQESGTFVYQTSFTVTDPRRFHVQLVDREGRSNKLPTEIVVNVTRNRPPVIKITQPAHDVRVSPVEELRLKADLEDDFGLVRQGVSYIFAGQEPQEIVLQGSEAASRRASAEYLIEFEKLKAVPDQLVTYFFWAEDVGPDGQPRRTSGDMFFAEVRHFEEIFRQGEQPPGGSEGAEQQGGNAQEAGRLADLQKEIINATWKLMRREIKAKPTAEFAGDSKLLQESQHSAIVQAAQLGEQLRDAVSKASLEQASQFMKDAEKHLTEAVKSASIGALSPALAAEQAAYQALLKLRAREFEVVRSNSRQRGQGGRGSAGSPSQRQLQQLELSAEENRYEQQSTARAQQDRLSQREQEQRETRQVINRLRELAQRQSDMNERLKELQSALEAAKTEQAREEIERQLKRLRDQQEQILRDTDELRERMEREENRDRMADARQQIEQSREHVRQASAALEEGRLSQAVTEGARAGRELNDLREELRKTASDRFSEEVTEMRDQARRLDEGQKKLSEQIDEWNRQPQHSLRDAGEREQVRKDLEQQRKQLDQLLDRMRNTVQDAEETQPLLAKGLYDTVRKATEERIPDVLKGTEQLVDLGVAEEAIKLSRRAGQGLQNLREGIERAAETVLGDETAALRRAQGELEDLADQVDRELARSAGRRPNEEENDLSRSAQRSNSQGQADPNQQRPDAQNSRQTGQQDAQKGEAAQQKGEQGRQKREQGQRKGQGQGQGGQQQRGGQGGQQDQQKQQGEQGQNGQGGGAAPQGDQPPQAGGNTPGDGQGGRPEGSPQGGGGGGGGGRQNDLDRMLQGLAGGPGGPGGPITGEGFRQWTDRMREVEELLEDPEMRAEAARIRDRVRGAREEFKRHATMPDWNKMKELVADPIHELRDRIAEEVRRRESPDSLVPIDRDPVPPQFSEGVRRYYERLGSGR
jgi:hypothetical protein